MRGRKSPRTWAEVYRELSAIDERTQAILADWQARVEEAVAEASCCLEISEILHAFRMRAWQRAVREHDRGGLARRSSRQLELF